MHTWQIMFDGVLACIERHRDDSWSWKRLVPVFCPVLFSCVVPYRAVMIVSCVAQFGCWLNEYSTEREGTNDAKCRKPATRQANSKQAKYCLVQLITQLDSLCPVSYRISSSSRLIIRSCQLINARYLFRKTVVVADDLWWWTAIAMSDCCHCS